jgi:PAS domain S-box-containing protein
MFKILFVCTGKSGRSQMAATFARKIAPSWVGLWCASDKKHSISKKSIEVMDEIGFDMPEKLEYSLKKLQTKSFDIVVTLCNKALEICPIFPGSPAKIHWPIIDPLSEDFHLDIEKFREVRDSIRERVTSLFNHGYVNSIRETRGLFRSLLNHLTDGVIAHDLDRNIFFVNDAAIKITGYTRREIIGNDCHKVFPGRFCGGDCSFCEENKSTESRHKYSRLFTKKNGEQLNLEMSVVTLAPPQNRVMGALVIFRDMTEVVHLRKRLEQSRGFSGIIGHHISMQKVFASIRELAEVKVPILIQGETGTGKEILANALHRHSSRASGPFVPINCGALPEGTLESELFGHVKGAFTGAINDRKGRFELAEGGTIFLDEIGEISQSMQVKLLRVLQESKFVPVGGERQIESNVRVICATNKNLKDLTQKRLFREDLYYRLAVVPINLPALRERKTDIPLLVDHFLDKYTAEIGRKINNISPKALKIFMQYHWPGNVRELSNAIQYAMIKCKDSNSFIGPEHLPPEILDSVNTIKGQKPGRPPKLNPEIVRDAIERCGGNKAKAAKLLGVSRTSIYRMIKEGNM